MKGRTHMDKSSGQHDTGPKLLDDSKDVHIDGLGEDADEDDWAIHGDGAGDEDHEQSANSQWDVVIPVSALTRLLGETRFRFAWFGAVPAGSVTLSGRGKGETYSTPAWKWQFSPSSPWSPPSSWSWPSSP